MSKSTGKVIGVTGNMVSVVVNGDILMNEVGYILVQDQRLKAEVIRVRGKQAEMQVFEMTKGIGIGDEVEFSRELLSVKLGPGLLGRIYDGLQNPLPLLADRPRGNFQASHHGTLQLHGNLHREKRCRSGKIYGERPDSAARGPPGRYAECNHAVYLACQAGHQGLR